MTKNNKSRVVEKFNKLDLHDDGLESVRICPARKSNPARVILELRDDSTGGIKILSFRDCGNLRHSMDFDVLANNWFAQTKGAAAGADVVRMKRFVRSQVAHWRVQYMPPSPSDKPVKSKLSAIKKYALFKVAFFGGTIEILARDFSIKRRRVKQRL